MTTIDTNTSGVPARILQSPKHWRNRKHEPHWRSGDEEFDAAKLGMWLFLSTEVLLFAGIFCGYAIFRMLYPEAWANGSHYLDWRMGAANTAVLLISSWTAANAVRLAQLDKQFWFKINIIVTIICALIFVGVKFTFEYGVKLPQGKAPGAFFSYPNAHDVHEPLWWSLYYVGTGIHAFHVIVGAILFGVVLWYAQRHQAYGPTQYTLVENSALYWHIVDLIWIFLFPLLYLIH
tara:strand:- start:558 stop:1259 length:702 start_codon:yes stop_codon:yes gene_type:complete